MVMAIEVHPVTPDRWDDLARLFGPSGAYSGCWCMWWRESAKDFERNGNAGNAMRSLVRDDRVPGMLAYRDGQPVGWVSVAPRPEFPRIERSPTLKPIDDRPVWSVVCFFIDRGHRRSGVARALLRTAVDRAAENGARLVEAYPVDPRERDYADAEAYTGVVPLFEAAGFREVARRGRRPILRRAVRRRARAGGRRD
jgi:GNAT superfamily N-acetyltransferase